MSPTTTRDRPAAASGGAGPRRRTPIDPRISDRRKAVTRQRGRRRLRLLGALVVLVVLLTSGWAILHLPWFSARVITVQGATHETPAQVIAAGGLAAHPALIGLKAGAVAGGIERLPWVRTARVQVHWPDGVHIVVTDQAPLLDIKTAAGSWAEITAAGRVVADSPTQVPGLFVLTGPAAPAQPGSVLGPADKVGLQVAATLPPSFKAQVNGVSVESGGWVQLTMTTPILVDIGTPTQLTQKYEDVSSILAGATLHDGDVIDVSVPDAPTVTGG